MRPFTALSVLVSTSIAQPVADFTLFENVLLDQWLSLFRVDSRAGAYSYDQAHRTQTSVYGASDVAHILFTVNSLNLTDNDAQSWANIINSFQNTSGMYTSFDYEESTGYQPWHATAFATSSVHLLGQQPSYAPQWALDIVQGGEQLWNATLVPLLNVTQCPTCTIWNQGHKIASIPSVLIQAGLGPVPPLPEETRHIIGTAAQQATALDPIYAQFWDWYFNAFLGPSVDPVTGTWCMRKEWAPPNVQCLGGAFHIFFIYTAAGVPWLMPSAVHAMSMGLQHAKGVDAGLWGKDYPQFIDLDGVYQVVRPAVQLGRPADLWQQSRQSCVAYLTAADAALNNATLVLQGALAQNTHNLAGTVAGVAECLKWFPNLAVTSRPWKQGLDYAPFV